MQKMLRSRTRGSRTSGAAGLWLGIAAVLLVLAAAPGCYTYTATDVSSLEPGEDIRVETGSGQIQSSAYGSSFLGPRRLEGKFERATQDSLVVSIWIGSEYRGTPFETAHQELPLPRTDVTRIENRQFNRTRTALTAVATVGLIASLIYGIDTITGGDPNDSLDIQPPEPESEGIPEARFLRGGPTLRFSR